MLTYTKSRFRGMKEIYFVIVDNVDNDNEWKINFAITDSVYYGKWENILGNNWKLILGNYHDEWESQFDNKLPLWVEKY